MAHRPIARPLPEPSDVTAYFVLLGRVIEAKDAETLIGLMEAMVTFEGGRFEDDFKREWLRNWLHYGKTIKDIPPWPRGGPFSRHAGPR